MSIDQDLNTLLAELRPVYDECGRLRTEWDNLQLLPRARKEYDQALEKETEELAQLREREKNLDEKKKELAPRPAPPPAPPTPWTRTVTLPIAGIGGAPLDSRDTPPPPPPAPPPPSGMSLAGRRALQKRIFRYADRWNLTQSDVEKINSIVDDANRPLGEALALLDWHLYSGPWLKSETDEAHLERVREWGDELKIYLGRLQTEIDIERATHSSAVPIWESWLRRDVDAEGRKAWEDFIEDSRQALVAKQAKTRESIAELQAWIAEHQATPGAGA